MCLFSSRSNSCCTIAIPTVINNNLIIIQINIGHFFIIFFFTIGINGKIFKIVFKVIVVEATSIITIVTVVIHDILIIIERVQHGHGLGEGIVNDIIVAVVTAATSAIAIVVHVAAADADDNMSMRCCCCSGRGCHLLFVS